MQFSWSARPENGALVIGSRGQPAKKSLAVRIGDSAMIEIKRKDTPVFHISFSEFRKCWVVVCLTSKKVIRCNSVSEAFAFCAKSLKAIGEPQAA